MGFLNRFFSAKEKNAMARPLPGAAALQTDAEREAVRQKMEAEIMAARSKRESRE